MLDRNLSIISGGAPLRAMRRSFLSTTLSISIIALLSSLTISSNLNIFSSIVSARDGFSFLISSRISCPNSFGKTLTISAAISTPLNVSSFPAPMVRSSSSRVLATIFSISLDIFSMEAILFMTSS